MTITKGAQQRVRYRREALFYASARDAMRDLLAHTASAQRGVLLPAFIGWSPNEGSGVLDPVRESGVPSDFYEVRADLTLDLDDLRRRLENGRHGIVVVIHYYGRTDPSLDAARALADEHGALLVEDLAHGFYSAATGGRAGTQGDVSLFSLHKMLPVPDGGMAWYGAPGLLAGQRSTRPELAAELLAYDWLAIAAHRRRVFTELQARLSALPEAGGEFTCIWPELAPGDVPQSLPVLVHHGRDEVYHAMNAAGLGVVSLYHTLVDEVRSEHARALARQIFNLPCHQDVELDDVPRLVDGLRAALAAR